MARTVRYLPPFARAKSMKRNPRPVAEVAEVVEAPKKAKKVKAEAPKLMAPKLKAEAPKPVVEPEPVRARDDDGHFVPDDPATPDVNESFVGGTPLKPEWEPRMNKKELLGVATKRGLTELSMEDTKKVIIAALEASDSTE